jgi:hypothetical protein
VFDRYDGQYDRYLENWPDDDEHAASRPSVNNHIIELIYESLLSLYVSIRRFDDSISDAKKEQIFSFKIDW